MGGFLLFQHTAARRRLHNNVEESIYADVFQHTAARRRLPLGTLFTGYLISVSTHSRPKAAALSGIKRDRIHRLFQHTAARRRLRNTARQTVMS